MALGSGWKLLSPPWPCPVSAPSISSLCLWLVQRGICRGQDGVGGFLGAALLPTPLPASCIQLIPPTQTWLLLFLHPPERPDSPSWLLTLSPVQWSPCDLRAPAQPLSHPTSPLPAPRRILEKKCPEQPELYFTPSCSRCGCHLAFPTLAGLLTGVSCTGQDERSRMEPLHIPPQVVQPWNILAHLWVLSCQGPMRWRSAHRGPDTTPGRYVPPARWQTLRETMGR